MSRRRVYFAEERSPSGAAGLKPIYLRRFSGRGLTPDLDDCLVSRVRPHLLVIWEPLLTKAPAPPKATPFCCYIQSVIFYHAPYINRPWSNLTRTEAGRWLVGPPGSSFEQWDRVETRLGWDDVVGFDGEVFEITGGSVVWTRRRWWVCRGARRRQAARVAA